MRPEDIAYEAFRVGGRTYMYFGPFPALLRVLPDMLAPSRYGVWSRASCFLAVIMCLGAVVAVTRRQLAGNERLDDSGRAILFFATLAAVALGSPLVVLGSLANLWHESILWGLCAALWGVFSALKVLGQHAEAWRSLTLLSAATGVAFLSRVTFGLPLYALTAGLALRLFILKVLRERQPVAAVAGRIALALFPALLGGLIYLWYNYARFGSLLDFYPVAFYTGIKPVGVDSVFHWSRVPSGALAYFRVAVENFSARVPFVTFSRPMVFRPELYIHLGNLVISPLLVSPWLVAVFMGGLTLPGRRGERRLSALGALPFAVQCLLILAYFWIAYRFTAEFLPFGVWLLGGYLRRAGAEGRMGRFLSPQAFALIVGVSSVATMLSLFHFQSQWWAYPDDYRQQVSRMLEMLDARLGLG